MPAYNAEAYIANALRSVLAQTVSRIEVIVVDDASTDETVKIVHKVMHTKPDKGPRIHLLQNDNNAGPSYSRNRALDAATAPWVTLLDADDCYQPERIECLLAACRKFKADLVADDLYFFPSDAPVDLERGILIDSRGFVRPLDRLFATTRRPCVLKPETFVSGRLPGGNDPRLALVKPLFRRAFLDTHGLRFQEHVTQSEDYVLYLDCLGAGGRFVLMDGPPLYGYRTHVDQTSRQDPLAAQTQRLVVNAQLLRRPYVKARPSLRRLLEERHRDLERDVAVRAFADDFRSASLRKKTCLVAASPRIFGMYLARQIDGLIGRYAGRLRRLHVRLAQILGIHRREQI